MKAAVVRKWGAPNVLQIEDIERPKPKNDQILIRVLASGINPIDWKQRMGNHKFILGSPFPVVLGYDVCGEVAETGSGVQLFKPGDVVFGNVDNKYGGALAEYALGHENGFVHKPDSLNLHEAAGITLAGLTAYQALRYKGNLRPGQTVLINGATGGVGHLAVQIAKIMGAQTIAVASSRNQAFMSELAPDKFIDYTKENLLDSDLKTDIFFDVAGKYTFPKIRHLLNPNGIYINTLPRPKILAHKLLQPFSKGKKVKTLLRKINREDLLNLREWMLEGKLKVEIDKVFDLKDVASAHEYSEKGHTKGKNIVIVNA